MRRNAPYSLLIPLVSFLIMILLTILFSNISNNREGYTLIACWIWYIFLGLPILILIGIFMDVIKKKKILKEIKEKYTNVDNDDSCIFEVKSKIDMVYYGIVTIILTVVLRPITGILLPLAVRIIRLLNGSIQSNLMFYNTKIIYKAKNKEIKLNYEQLGEIKLTQNILEKLLGIGKIKFYLTQDKKNNIFYIESGKDIKEIYDKIICLKDENYLESELIL